MSAHTDERAARASAAMGAEAFAVGNRVAFGGAPSLHTAAHEAAHVVQQRAGVQLKGGVGEEGDPYERHADRVADAVVAGRSAEGLLDEHAPADRAGGGGGGAPVQAKFVGPLGDLSTYKNTSLVKTLVEGFKGSSHYLRVQRTHGHAPEAVDDALEQLAHGDQLTVKVQGDEGGDDHFTHDGNYQTIVDALLTLLGTATELPKLDGGKYNSYRVRALELYKKIESGQTCIRISEQDLKGNPVEGFKATMLSYLGELLATPLGLELMESITEMGAKMKSPFIQLIPSDEYRTLFFDAMQRENAPEFARLKELEGEHRTTGMALGLAKALRKQDKVAELGQKLEAITQEMSILQQSLFERNQGKDMYGGGLQHGVTVEVEPKARKDEYALDKNEQSTGWHTERQKFGLYHELIHAHHMMKGDQAKGDHGGVGNAEWQVLGKGPYENEKFSEKSIRGAMGKPDRPHYDKKVYT